MQLTLDMKSWVESKIEELTLEEKAFLLSGVDIWRTHAVPRLSIPQLKVRLLFLTPPPIGRSGKRLRIKHARLSIF